MFKKSFVVHYRASFKNSTNFLVDWVNHFGMDKTMPSVVAYKAQLRLRGVVL